MNESDKTDAAPAPQKRLRRGGRAAAEASPRLNEAGALRIVEPAGEDSLPRAGRPEALDRDYLLYDHFKHLTTLALLTLGGVLTLSQTADLEDVEPVLVISVLLVVGLAAVAAFIGASEIVRARHAEVEVPSLNLYRIAAPALLLLGVGMFLYLFVDGLIR